MSILTALILAAQPAPAAATPAQPAAAGEVCELHVSGAANITHPFVRRTLAMRVPVADTELNQFEQSANGFVLHPTVRAARLERARFTRLFPEGSRVDVILHGEVQDERRLRRSEARLYRSDARCYGDLVISNIYGVFPDFDQARARLGPLSGIVGGNRVHMTFRYHYFNAGMRRPLRVKESVDVPLQFSLTAIERLSAQDIALSLAAATDRAFALFLERHRERLP